MFKLLKKSSIKITIKKCLERRKHCALAVRWSQKFSPRSRTPSQGCRTAKI